ncbi:hypothetical protein [Thiohalorhabdus methylotrophus]|uniref:Uncharacterized protein n=1 Tax=Thiohalorhabdus methylotrophus TaxID=3242694 RepID=A0ABV4TRD5_9GAMM
MRSMSILGAVLLVGLLTPLVAAGERPYIAASHLADGGVAEVVPEVKTALRGAGFRVAGSYSPMGRKDRAVVVATDPALLRAIGSHPETGRGGHPIAGAGLRIGLLRSRDGGVEVSYVNPAYLYQAYFQEAYPEVRDEVRDAGQRLQETLGGLGEASGAPFGGAVEELSHYHYMLFMPYFEDRVTLAEHADFHTALRTVRANLRRGVAETEKVYEVVLSDEEQAVLGVAMNDPDHGTPSWYPELVRRHVAALPYELYVVGGTVYMLHGRYRIALSWPELSMATFSNIMDAPGDTERILRRVAAGD